MSELSILNKNMQNHIESSQETVLWKSTSSTIHFKNIKMYFQCNANIKYFLNTFIVQGSPE